MNDVKRGSSVKEKLRPVVETLKQTQGIFAENEMSVYSGYTTLYILMAMVPLLTLMIGIVNLLPDVSLQHLETALLDLLPDIEQLKTMVHTVVKNVNRKAGNLAVSVSLIASLWSASNGVNALQLGLQKISGSGGTFLRQRAAALLYTLLFLALIPAMFIFRVLRGSIEALIGALNNALNIPVIAGKLLNLMDFSGAVTALAMAAIILLAYTFLRGGPRRKLKYQLPGTLFTTVLWLAFSAVFEIFITRFWKASSLYGSLASVFLAAMWLKTITTILFYGAALNEALNRRRGA